MSRPKFWTTERDQVLRELYSTVGAREAALRIGTTVHGVRSRAEILKLRGSPRRPRRWSPELDQKLTAAYSAGGLSAAIEVLPNFSPSAVKNRIHKLKPVRPSRNWRPDEDAFIRQHYGRGLDASAVAKHLGRTQGAVWRRAKILGIRNEDRHWAPEQIEAVRVGYASCGPAALAVELLGSASSGNMKAIYALASKLGVTLPVRHPDSVYERVRQLHSEGKNDRQIAEAMSDYFPGRNDRERVTSIRTRIGLPRNKTDMRPVVARQLQTLGISNPAELRNRAHRKFAESYGLPGDLTVRQVQIVVRLSRGPATIAELRADIGMTSTHLNRPKGHSNRADPGITQTYFSDLTRRGLVAFVEVSSVHGHAPCRRFMLTPLAMELLADIGQHDQSLPSAPKETAR